MQQPFLLSFPRSMQLSEVDEGKELHFWRTALDRLAEKKWSWERFLQGMSLFQHPSLKLVTSKEENTLLHLAVLSNRLDLVQQLIAIDAQLKFKRNLFGLTPLELSQFLDRKEIAKVLSPFSQQISFPLQPNISFDCNTSFVDLEYLSHPVFESEEIFEDILLRAQKAKTDDLIPAERIWMGVYFDNEIQRGIPPKLSIRHIDDDVGYGVFAKQRIAPCAFVGEYTGVIRHRKKKLLKEEIYSVRYTFWGAEKKKFILDGKSKGNFSRFINHSDHPNLCLQTVYWRGIPRMIFVALKEIPKDAQLTFDYGILFWQECRQTPKLL